MTTTKSSKCRACAVHLVQLSRFQLLIAVCLHYQKTANEASGLTRAMRCKPDCSKGCHG